MIVFGSLRVTDEAGLVILGTDDRVSIGKQAQYGLTNGVVALEYSKQHHNNIFVAGESLHVLISTQRFGAFRYF